MNTYSYDRKAAVEYASKWAIGRNPAYYNFDKIGGDCTNFASQCIFAGCKTMNYAKDVGWYYISLNNRAAAWTDAQFLYNFLVRNEKNGPFAKEVTLDRLSEGDLVQLFNGREHYHSLVVMKIERGEIFVGAHSNDVHMYPLRNYFGMIKHGLHIEGVRR